MMDEEMYGLLGVLIGAGLTWFQSWRTIASERAKAARYLAMRVVCVLDRYVDACCAVVLDDGRSQGQRDEEGYLVPQVVAPAPIEYPTDVDWRSVDHALMYDLLSLPYKCELASGATDHASEIAFPPDFEEYFEARQRQYVILGLTAAALADRLRATYSIPALDRETWDPVERMQKVRDEFERQDKASQPHPMVIIP